MNPKCMQAVMQAVGRQMTKAEIEGIDARLMRQMRSQARADPAAFHAKSLPDRLAEAAKGAAQELLGEAQLKQKRTALSVLAHQRTDQHIAGRVGVEALDTLDRAVAFHADMKSNTLSVESQANAIRDDSLRQMIGTMTASNPKWFGLFENREGVEAIVREIFGESSGKAEASAGAKQWKEVTDALRERFNRAGGDIGTLDDWGMPHHHSQGLVAKAGRDKWVADILPLIDRDHYFNPDGSPMGDKQIADFLGHAWASIATGGANKLEPGRFAGGGARSNRGSASRQVHFRDADSYMKYQDSYGERSLYEVLTGHIDGISKDIALTETFGPNPDNTYRYYRDKAVIEGKLADPTQVGKLDERALKSDTLYNIVTGKRQPVASQWLAESFDTLRSWLVASRLGSSVITSFSDDATMHLTAQMNNLPEMRLLANELAAFNPANRTEERIAQRAGLGLRTMVSSLNRFGQDNLGSSFAKKLASTVIRVQGLNAMTEARRRAFGATMMGGIGGVVKDHGALKDLDVHDNRILLSKGINETDFAVWKQAQLEDWGGGNDTMLTPESIYRIPDAAIDTVIAPKIQSIRDTAKAQIDELAARDAQDQSWMSQRSANLGAWVAKQQGQLTAKIGKASGKAVNELTALQERMQQLETQIELSKSFWDETVKPTSIVREVGSSSTGKQTGRAKLRNAGVSEGQAREAIKSINSESRGITADMQRLKKELTGDFVERWGERQAELMEFTDGAKQRMQARAQVAARIAKQIDPGIEAARTQAREQAATKLLAAVLEETDVAVIEPGAKEQAMTGGGLQRGTWKGELTKSFFLFKSFPLAMIARHWERGMSLPNKGGRAAYIATLMAATTVLGAASLQVNEVLSGRDPRNLNPAKKGGVRNWISAMLKGGSLGIYGDFLFSDATQHGQSPVASFMGPVVGLGEDMFNLTQGNIMQAAAGKDTHWQAEAVKFLKSNTPGANLWYAKAALDHLIFHQLQEHFSPGYLGNMRARAEKEFGQKYWWEPGEVVPDRAPNVAASVGE